MLLIGERINGMFKDIGEAVLNHDPDPIKYWARHQYEAGAHYLDVNTGPTVLAKEQAAVMEWMVKICNDTVPLPCCIDSTNPEAIEAGCAANKHGKAMINSTNADQRKMDIYLPMALKYNTAIIGLTMNKRGVPKSAADRAALAMEIVVNADMHGFPMEDLYIDPLMLPANVAQDHGVEVLEAIRQIKALAPGVKTTIGLSNASQRCTNRRLLNRTFLIMCMAVGLDSAIVDMDDEALTDTVAAANVLLNKDIYCDSFLKTFRQR
ncbi:MAG: methyltetrahydrofolate cobalamin methyltransferase [Bacillota bacterium]